MLRGTPASVGSCSSPGGPLEPGGGDAAAALMPGTGGGEESLAVAWTQQGDEEKLWAAAMAAVEAACSGEAAPEAEAAAPALVAPAAVLLQLPAPPPPLKGRVCIPCRMARVRCSLQVPCDRCFRLCIQCKQSVRKPYTRRLGVGGAEGHDEEEGAEQHEQEEEEAQGHEAASAKNGGGSAAPGGKARAGRKRRLEEAAAAAAAEPPPQDATPLTELTISRNDPKAHAGMYLKGFQRLLQEGRVIRDRVLALMRVWRVWSVAAGVDVTWGLLGQLTHALDVNPAELEERETLRWDVSAEGRVQRAQRQVQSMGRISKSLEQLPVFKQADDGHTGMFVAVFGGPPPKGDAAWGGSDEGAGICLQACNAPLVRVLQAAAFASQGIMQYKTIQVLNTLGFIAPADRETYLYRVQELLFTDTRAISDIFKAAYNNGRVRLYLFSARRVELEGDGSRVCLLHRVEACPSSRHVTDKPEALKTRVAKHYKPYQPRPLRAPEPLEPPSLFAPAPAPAPSSASSLGSDTDTSGCTAGSSSAASAYIPAVAVAAMIPAPGPRPPASTSPLPPAPAALAAAAAALTAGERLAGYRFGMGGSTTTTGDGSGALFGATAARARSSGDGGGAYSSAGWVNEEATLVDDIAYPRPPHPSPAAAGDYAAPPATLAYNPFASVSASASASATASLSSSLASPPSANASLASSSASEDEERGAMVGMGAGGGMGGGTMLPGRRAGAGNGLRPPQQFPAVPVFDEARMDQIFE